MAAFAVSVLALIRLKAGGPALPPPPPHLPAPAPPPPVGQGTLFFRITRDGHPVEGAAASLIVDDDSHPTRPAPCPCAPGERPVAGEDDAAPEPPTILDRACPPCAEHTEALIKAAQGTDTPHRAA